MRQTCARLHCPTPMYGHRQVILPYTPSKNLTVEVVFRELFKALPVSKSEYKVPQLCWNQFYFVLQSILNNTPFEQLGIRCLFTVFTSLPQDTALTTIKSTMK